MSSGDEHEVPERKKRYHRHTPRQIQELEATFRVSPHPDDKQRLQLSKDLGLEPRQIKFWFQNRRTQLKSQHDRKDNCSLRAENNRIRSENIAMLGALKNAICPHCDNRGNCKDNHFDAHKLRAENARLKEELDHMSGITSKYLGRPITQLPPIQPISINSLDLSVGSYFNPENHVRSLELDVLSNTNNPSMLPSIPSFPAPPSDNEKPLLANLATRAMDELIRLVQTDEPLWVKSYGDGKDILSLDTYDRIFQKKPRFLDPNIRIEASRDSAVMFMSSVALVEMFMDSAKWIELFPTIISRASTVNVIANGTDGTKSGSLLLMSGEFQVLSALIPTRQFLFLRCIRQIENGLYAIVDVSVDFPMDPNQLDLVISRTKRLPSGCFIQDMPHGYSKVTWVEHMEVDANFQTHQLFRDLVDSGVAFGAQRWLATLQRACERFQCFMAEEPNSRDIGGGGVIPTPEGKRSMMKLSQRMLRMLFGSLSNSSVNQWNTVSDTSNVRVRIITQRSSSSGQPNKHVLCAATSLWFPLSCQKLLSFFRDEKVRNQWDILCRGNVVQEVARITTGLNPGNSISLLRTCAPDSQNSLLILQECCTDASGSVVVYSPIDLQAINVAMSGEDTSNVSIVPSGFAILPDGRPHCAGMASTSVASSSSMPVVPAMPGSILTVSFQLLVSSSPSTKLDDESVDMINSLVDNTVSQIKSALNCP